MEQASIGKYRVVERIGRGAMGEVFKAFDPVLNRHVAVKTLPAQMGSDSELRKRFEREAQSAARLNHPNIITVYELGEETGQIFIAMELLQGSDLKDVMSAGTLATLDAKLRVMEQVLDGVAFAHRHEVVHRDLKPANIRLLPSGQVKVMDFGLARLTGSEMTQAGTIMGTPHYMAPEQVRGETADARCDVFALGAVFYELLGGRRAFEAESLHAILRQVLHDEPPPLTELAAGVPVTVAHVVAQALAKERAARYASAAEMREALRASRGASGDARGDGSQWGSRPWNSVAGGSVAGATALARSPEPAPTLLPGPTRGARTLPGTGDTMLEAPEHEEAAPARGGLYAALGVAAALALAGGGYAVWRWTRPAPSPRPEVAHARAGALREALVDTNIELARMSAENKAWDDAVRQAEQALAVDPQSTAAREVLERARAALAERDAQVAEARQALQRNDVPRASQALTRLLALDPRHPAVSELSRALNASFRAQAEEARSAAQAARAEAARQQDGAGASATHGEAERLLAEGEASLGAQEFAVATQKFALARDAFARAQRSAAESAARRAAAEAQRQAESQRQVQAESQRQAEAARQAEQQRQAEAQRRQAESRSAASPPGATPAGLAPTAPAAAAGGAQEVAIRQVLADYARAIESKDLALFGQVKPNLSDDERRRLEAAFRAVKSHQVRLAIESIEVRGGEALVRASRHDTLNGKPSPPLSQSFRLLQTAGAWRIESIGR